MKRLMVCYLNRPVEFAPLALLLMAALPSMVAGQRVIYVHSGADGADNGTNWSNAFHDLQDALADAAEAGGCPCEIWVAAGIYRPDGGTLDRLATFRMMSRVALYGGFDGTETCHDERDWAANETILDGDLLENDEPEPNSTDPCCVGELGTECLNQECLATVCETQLICCVDEWWLPCATRAKAMCCELCRPSRCDNTYHIVTVTGVDGSAVLDGFIIRNGEANGDYFENLTVGGGVFAQTPVSTNITSSPTIRNCVFERNGADTGSAVYITEGDPSLMNCLFRENQSFSRGALRVVSENRVVVKDCIFNGNIRTSLALSGDGVAEVVNCKFMETNDGRGADVFNDRAEIRNCLFLGNSLSGTGGALNDGANVHVLVSNTEFIGNHSTGGAGAYSIGAPNTINNCLFAGNTTTSTGGAVNVGLSSATLTNCTIVSNTAGTSGGIWSVGSIGLKNTLLWGNEDNVNNGSPQNDQIKHEGSISVSYTTIQDWDGTFGGTGNNGIDPQFVDPEGADGVIGTLDDNYRLSATSPAVNTGSLSFLRSDAYADLDEHARVLCAQVDRGAYEFGIGDYNCDRVVELVDFGAFPGCMTGPHGGPYVETCEAYDFRAEVEDRIDLLDFAGLQNEVRP